MKAIKLLKEFKSNGIKYNKFIVSTNNTKNYINLLVIPKRDFTILPVKAKVREVVEKEKIIRKLNNYKLRQKRPVGRVFKYLPLEKPTSIVSRYGDLLFAVNGSFFLDYGALKDKDMTAKDLSYFGDAVGWCRISGNDYNLPTLHRPIILVSEGGDIKIKNLNLTDGILKIGKNKYKVVVHTVNSDKINSVCYFTPDYGEIEIKKDKIYFEIINNVVGKIVNKSKNDKIRVPHNGVVVSLPMNDNKFEKEINTGVNVCFEYNENRFVHAISAGPTLVKGGRLTDNSIWEEEDFNNRLHPYSLTKDLNKYPCARTGLFLSEKYFLLSVCEGLYEGKYTGMTLNEFAKSTIIYTTNLLKIDIKSGVYIDGGQEATMVSNYKNRTEILNYPSGISNPSMKGVKPGHEAYTSMILGVKRISK